MDNDTAATVINAGSLASVSGNLDISGKRCHGHQRMGPYHGRRQLTVDNDTAATVINAGISLPSAAISSAGIRLPRPSTQEAHHGRRQSQVDNDTAATVIDAGSLATVGGNLDLTGNMTVVTIDLSALIQAGAIVISNNGVVTLNLSALVKAGGDARSRTITACHHRHA